eukprot:5892072-Pyramimonas_sp.AAC.1
MTFPIQSTRTSRTCTIFGGLLGAMLVRAVMDCRIGRGWPALPAGFTDIVEYVGGNAGRHQGCQRAH